MPTAALLPLLLLMAFPDTETPPKYKAWIANHEICMEMADVTRQVGYDPLATEPIAASPSGDRVVYGQSNPIFDVEHCFNTPRKFVVLVNSFGQTLWKAALQEACEDFEKFEWIDTQRIGVMLCGRANCVYWVLEAATGKVLQKFFGGFDFLWSHDRRFVAHRSEADIKLDTNTIGEVSTLMFNDDDSIYPPINPKTHSRYDRQIIADLTWSPNDAWLSFPEVEYPSYNSFVVLVSPDGRVLRDSLPVDVYDAVIRWTDDHHFQVRASERTFKFMVDDGGLHQFAERSR